MLLHSDLADIAGRSYSGPQSGSVGIDVRYDLVPRQGELVIVMPGTHPADPLDWLRDFSVVPTWLPRIGPVHSGFGAGGSAIWDKIKFDLPHMRVTLTGHSLGGALAQVVAAHLSYWRPDLSFRVVTFGAPRAGFLNPFFGHLIRRGLEAVEYQRSGDIVPNVPGPWPLYNHPTRRVRIGVSAGSFILDHQIARYAADLRTLNL